MAPSRVRGHAATLPDPRLPRLRRVQKVLIANRGEIAVRVARACRDAGLRSVAVYADPDRDALHVTVADEAYALGGETAAETYLDMAKLIDVATRSGADAVHPGYGFLSENADFAEAVIEAGLTWIGPPPHAIRSLGDKVSARHIAARAGAPQVAGTADPVTNSDEVVAFAREHGLPVAIKAAFGGGGRGLKVARTLEEIPELYDSAVREAVAAFGRGECFVERYLDNPRHVETQVLADQHGNIVVVSTRDCSLQRRHQKLVEEAPAPFLTDAQVEELYRSSKAIIAEAGYYNAGTCEFLVGEDGTIQGLLNILGIPYTHSGVRASAVAMDKPTAKDVFARHGLRCPEGRVVTLADFEDGEPMAPPYVIKPIDQGSSVGVHIVREGDNYRPTAAHWPFGDAVLVERYIAGRELTVAVWDGEAMEVTEITSDRGFYDYEAKYSEGGSVHLLPAPLPETVHRQAMDMAAGAFRSLGCRGIGRADFRYDDTAGDPGELYLLEINTQPGMTPTSLVPEQAAHRGISFPDLVSRMVEDARCDS